MAVCSRIVIKCCYDRYLRYCCQRLYSSTDVSLKTDQQKDTQEIIVPYRISRGPTDLLKALSSTIRKDYTAANYKYEDDPYFIPVSNVSKRSYALSKESGKKAARYFLENYSEFFRCNKSDPFIKHFDPPIKYTEESEVSEDILKSCIQSTEVTNALTVHELLLQKDIAVSIETQQDLLELLCFYNCEDPPNEDYYEERWFAIAERNPGNTWKNNGPAEKLFESMDKDNGAAYYSMIQGCAKFRNAERAMFLFDNMCSKGFKGSTETYNALISIVAMVRQDGQMRWQLATDFVNCMNNEGLSPDIGTMNGLFNVISKSKRWEMRVSMATQLLAEMQKMGIEPSLGTYHHLLSIFHFSTRGYTGILSQIMEKIEGKTLTIRHPDDVLFFLTAMEICNKYEEDKELAYRLHALLEHDTNCHLIGNAFSESIYFQNFFKLLCHTEDFDKFMEVYERYVPHSYIPEPSVMSLVVLALDFASAYHHLPKICSDIMLFEQTERENLLLDLIKVISSLKHEEVIQQQLVTLVSNIVEKLDKRAENTMRTSIQWTGELLSGILMTYLNGSDLQKAWSILERLKLQEESIAGYPDVKVLEEFCKVFLCSKEFQKVAFCVKYAETTEIANLKPEVLTMVTAHFQEGQINEEDRSIIYSLLEVEEDDIVQSPKLANENAEKSV